MNEFRQKLYDEWRENNADDPAKAVGWRNQEALDARFNCTLKHLETKDFNGVSVLDVGCGASLNLLRYLSGDFIYVGIDCNDESLKYASEQWGIPYNKDLNLYNKKQLLRDEFLVKVRDWVGYDVIISQGIYQEFDSIKDIRSHVCNLARLLNPGGELLIMTPVNRLLDAEGRSVLKISAYDAVSILEDTGLPWELALGELGEHLIMRVYKKD